MLGDKLHKSRPFDHICIYVATTLDVRMTWWFALMAGSPGRSKSVESSDGATQRRNDSFEFKQTAESAKFVPPHSRNDNFEFKPTMEINVALDNKLKNANVNACVIRADCNGESQPEHVVLSRVGIGMCRCAWHAQSSQLATRLYTCILVCIYCSRSRLYGNRPRFYTVTDKFLTTKLPWGFLG